MLQNGASVPGYSDELPSVPEDVRQRLYHCLDLDEFIEKSI
jgi:hypothetical protein